MICVRNWFVSSKTYQIYHTWYSTILIQYITIGYLYNEVSATVNNTISVGRACASRTQLICDSHSWPDKWIYEICTLMHNPNHKILVLARQVFWELCGGSHIFTHFSSRLSTWMDVVLTHAVWPQEKSTRQHQRMAKEIVVCPYLNWHQHFVVTRNWDASHATCVS